MLVERKKAFREKYPDKHLLSDSISETESYLKKMGWISNTQQVKSIEKPAEDSMSLVLKVYLSEEREVIIKQSRPWVEKNPQIDAPEHRLDVENQYYKVISGNPVLARMSPKVLGYDESSSVMLMSDLGEYTDLTFIYGSNSEISVEDLTSCFNYLNNLQKQPIPIDFPENQTMKMVNHENIFQRPFQNRDDNDLDSIQPGLKVLSQVIRKDTELKKSVERLGKAYLSIGSCLLHGNFYTRNLLKTERGLVIRNPEYAYCGPYEWDYSKFMAHLYLAQTPKPLINQALDLIHNSDEFDFFQFAGFAGIEIIQRLIGSNELPIALSIDEKAALIDKATEWIKFGI